MSLILLLVLCFIPLTYCTLTQDVLEHVDRQRSGECPIPENIFSQHCDTESRNGAYGSMTQCTGYSHKGEVVPLVCADGFWIPTKSTDSNEVGHRSKRFFGFIIAAVAITMFTGLVCACICGGQPDNQGYKRDELPVIHHCPKDQVIVAKESTKTATATWGKVTCTDDYGECDLQRSGPNSGSTFDHKTTIQYTATDNRNQKTYCSFTIKLTVRTCSQSSLGYPSRSTRTCSPHDFIYGNNVIYGTTCNFKCDRGYELHGSSVVKCGVNGDYIGTMPTCEAIKCPKPLEVKNGHIQCKDSTFIFNTVCFLRCDDGYSSYDSPSSIQCKENRTWSSDFQDCVDTEPPKLRCPGDLKVFAERSSRYANVSWGEPQTTDNSGGDIRLNRTAEISNGEMAPVGVHRITFSAEDETGNRALCSFSVTVEEITCTPPRLTHQNILYDCPNDFGYGQSCNLSCLYRYPLVGLPLITCEKNESDPAPRGYWHWNSTEEPYCIENICTPLNPPMNGALSCSTVGPNKFCKMLCNEKFDIPKTISPVDLIVCDNEGKWNPIQQVPDCTEKRNPGSLNLPGEMFYFTGDCNNKTIQDEIKKNFIDFADEKSSQGWGNFCPASPCIVQDVEVSCGPTKRKKRYLYQKEKRSAYEIMLTFKISMPWVDRESDGFVYNSELIEKLASVITNASTLGELNVAGLKPENAYFGNSVINCPKGQTSRYSTGSCAGCPTGTFYEDTSDECKPCRKGTYQDEGFQLVCKQCPDGMSTEAEGATSYTSCKGTCPSGYYSSFGTVPCSPCTVGFYQPSRGSTECIQCPEETVTELAGRTDVAECKGFDIRFESDDTASLGSVPPSTSLIVSSFWLRVPFKNNSDEWFSYSDSISSLTFRDTIFFEGKRVNRTDPLRYSSWIYVLVETDLYMNTTKLLIDEKEVALENVISGTTPVGVTFRGSKNTLLSSFVLTKSKRNSDNLKNNATCASSLEDALFNMDTFKSMDSTILKIQAPSQCDPFDECLSNPCGIHECTNLLEGYTCRCINGYTGTNCDTPPDYCIENDCSNGSTCRSGSFNYTCECSTGYRGPLCNVKIVNGNWGDWMEWSSCTQSCDGGTRYRDRYCDNPPADPDGEQCTGESNQTEACNQQNCPACPPTRSIRQYGHVFNCTETDDLISCSVRCRSGLTFVRGHQALEQYMCGKMTQYEWNAAPPPCSKAKSPEKIETNTNVVYNRFPCNSAENVKSLLYENVQGLQCVVNKTCQNVVSITGCSDNARDKRDTKRAVVDISLSTTLEGGDNLKLEEFFESNIVTPALLEYIQAYADLETSLQQMNSSEPFRFQSQGISYNAESIAFDVTLTCETGSVQSYGLCVDCPAGSRQELDQCVMCERGYYQDENGQTECKLCPSGFTTNFVGSRNHADCRVSSDDVGSKTRTTETTENGATLVIALSVVGTLVAVTSAVIFSYVFRKYLRRRERYQRKCGSKVSLGMVRPTTNKH